MNPDNDPSPLARAQYAERVKAQEADGVLVSCPVCTNEYHSKDDAQICAVIEKRRLKYAALNAVAVAADKLSRLLHDMTTEHFANGYDKTERRELNIALANLAKLRNGFRLTQDERNRFRLEVVS